MPRRWSGSPRSTAASASTSPAGRATTSWRCGGAAALAEPLPEAKSAAALKAEPDARYLSLMSLRVFSAGLKHSMVKTKWPAFEDVFFGFDPPRVRAINDEGLEALMKEDRIIRHWGKIKATRANAAAMCDIAGEHGSFGAWLAGWPADDIVGLWNQLTGRFSQLGGASGPYFLRMAGKDTFMLTPDVIRALNGLGVAKGKISGKRDRAAVQEVFNGWMDETGRPLCQLSRILALSVG